MAQGRFNYGNIKGNDGKSAYDIAKDNGFIGTEEQWLQSLKGAPGEGVATGGKSGQLLSKKTDNDYDTEWIDNDFVIDKDYVHTDNNFTNEDKEKLDNLSNYDDTDIRNLINDKQDKLVSGVNIKTINNASILGEGNIDISGGTGGTNDYEQLKNKPSINGVVLSGNKTSEDLNIDQDFVKDKNYVHTDNNFTTPLLNKLEGIQEGANNYSLPISSDTVLGGVKIGNNIDIDEEGKISVKDTNKIDDVKVNGISVVSNKIADINVPTKTSDLTNDSGFIANSTEELINYYKKTESYNQTQVNDLLNNKADKTEIPTKVSELENDKGYISEIPVASATQLGGVKIGDNLVITEDGVLSSVGGSTGTTDYNALSNKPALNTNNSTMLEVKTKEEINGTISLHKISKTGNYNDLLNKPELPTKTSQLTNDGENGTNPFISEIPIASATKLGGIKVGNNLTVDLDGTLNASESGVKDYNDLTNRPILNTNVSTSQPVSEGETISGEIVLHQISKTGSYTDLLNKPTIPTKVSQLDNDENFIDNSVNNLTNYYNKEQNDVLLGNKANIDSIPTKVSELTNDSNFQNEEEVNNSINHKLWIGTKAEYDALTEKETGVIYNIKDEYNANEFGDYIIQVKSSTDVLEDNNNIITFIV